MFFIFGFGKQTIKTRWTETTTTCPRCHNTKYWPYKKITYWFTFFFIPLVPYKVIYVTVCPICGHFEEINRETFEKGFERGSEDINSVKISTKPGMTEIQRRFNQEMATYDHLKQKEDESDYKNR